MSTEKFPLIKAAGLPVAWCAPAFTHPAQNTYGSGGPDHYVRAQDLERVLQLYKWRNENGEESIRIPLKKPDTADDFVKDFMKWTESDGDVDRQYYDLVDRAKKLIEREGK